MDPIALKPPIELDEYDVNMNAIIHRNCEVKKFGFLYELFW
jgi:hypothetical protein